MSLKDYIGKTIESIYNDGEDIIGSVCPNIAEKLKIVFTDNTEMKLTVRVYRNYEAYIEEDD